MVVFFVFCFVLFCLLGVMCAYFDTEFEQRWNQDKKSLTHFSITVYYFGLGNESNDSDENSNNSDDKNTVKKCFVLLQCDIIPFMVAETFRIGNMPDITFFIPKNIPNSIKNGLTCTVHAKFL